MTAPLDVAVAVEPAPGEETMPPGVMTRFAELLQGASTRLGDADAEDGDPADRMPPAIAPVEPCESSRRVVLALGLTLPRGVTEPRGLPWLCTVPDPYGYDREVPGDDMPGEDNAPLPVPARGIVGCAERGAAPEMRGEGLGRTEVVGGTKLPREEVVPPKERTVPAEDPAPGVNPEGPRE